MFFGQSISLFSGYWFTQGAGEQGGRGSRREGREEGGECLMFQCATKIVIIILKIFVSIEGVQGHVSNEMC